MDRNPDRYSVRIADIRVSKVAVALLRWGFSPWGIWVLRERRRNNEKIKQSLTEVARSFANYLVDARKLQVESQKVADATRRLTWVVVGLTLVNVAFVAYSAVR